MHRKDMIHMLLTIAGILVVFFALQAWLIPTPDPRPTAPTDTTEPADTDTTAPADEDTPSEIPADTPEAEQPEPAEENPLFQPIERLDAVTHLLRNSRLTAVISERGAVLERLEYVDHNDNVVYWQTPNDPRDSPHSELVLLQPSDLVPNIAPLGLHIDEHDDLRNSTRWELVDQQIGDHGANTSLTFRYPTTEQVAALSQDGSYTGTVLFKTLTLLPDTYRIDVQISVQNHGPASTDLTIGVWGPVDITNDGMRSSSEYTRIALYGSTESRRYSSLEGWPPVRDIGRRVNRRLLDMGRDDRPWVTNRELDDITNPDRFLVAHGLRTQYFLAFLGSDPDTTDGRWTGRILPIGDAGRTGAISLVAPPFNVPAARDGAPGEASRKMLFYAGPRDKLYLEDAWRIAPPEDEFVPVQWTKLGTSGFFDLIASPLIWLLRHLTSAVGAGLAIIFLTLIVRLLLSPLSYRGQKAMAVYAQKMKVVKPKLDAIKEKYAGRKDRDNQMKMLTETREAMKAENVGMLPLGGCLPILLQLPIFIGLYRAFGTAFFLRQAEFLWIKDLSLPDATIPGSWYIGEGWLSFIAYNGFLTLNILPVLWIVLAIVQFRMQPKPDDPQQQAIQKQMGCIFPLMGVIFYGFAAGFALYFIVSSLYSIGESKLIKYNLRKQGVLPPAGAKTAAKVKEGDKPDYHTA
jgi:YidC/Oxa1 family membrane protein insertase